MNFSINLKVKFMPLKAPHNPALPMFVVHRYGNYTQAIPNESLFLKHTMKFHNPMPLIRPLTHPQACLLSLPPQPPQFHWMKFYCVPGPTQLSPPPLSCGLFLLWIYSILSPSKGPYHSPPSIIRCVYFLLPHDRKCSLRAET